jgi:hypothetical protein
VSNYYPLLAKNMKDLFIKKLQICTKTYDYSDETKDVKGKVKPTYLLERVTECDQRASEFVARAEECYAADYS